MKMVIMIMAMMIDHKDDVDDNHNDIRYDHGTVEMIIIVSILVIMISFLFSVSSLPAQNRYIRPREKQHEHEACS